MVYGKGMASAREETPDLLRRFIMIMTMERRASSAVEADQSFEPASAPHMDT
jgi:hypothetical protein